ncbi:MAG: hypothetical protein Q9168_004844 [Polycauliona sp. 1 TL-2023]
MDDGETMENESSSTAQDLPTKRSLRREEHRRSQWLRNESAKMRSMYKPPPEKPLSKDPPLKHTASKKPSAKKPFPRYPVFPQEEPTAEVRPQRGPPLNKLQTTNLMKRRSRPRSLEYSTSFEDGPSHEPSREDEHMVQSQARSAAEHQQGQPQAVWTSTDYDEDTYIVDPQSHFAMLKQLERDVVLRSEYFRSEREYDFNSTIIPVNDDGVFLDEIGLRAPLQRKIHIIEVRSISVATIYRFEQGLESAIDQIVETRLEPHSLIMNLTNLAMEPCQQLLEQIGYEVLQQVIEFLSYDEFLAAIRKTALVVDVALVSYVRSHASGFDGNYFSGDLDELQISDRQGRLAFRCFWAGLACLGPFLDGKKVWVFDFFDPQVHVLSSRREQQEHGLVSLLARIEDLADIWGPVYTVPSSTGLVKYYGVSKGIICKVKPKTMGLIPAATPCHYYSGFSFHGKRTSRLLSRNKDLLLSKGELLLIGAGFRNNERCDYTTSAFTKEFASEMTVLGTKESVWKTDSRGITVGLSKYLGVTVSGTQKLIPQTTRKQQTLDRWTASPSRRNPKILNQYLGVEISHCTGNARRISLKEVMTSKLIAPILERQTPSWPQTPWGNALCSALTSTNTEDIATVWKDHAANRKDIADLVCCTLEVLDTTGWNEQEIFNSAILVDNEELAVSVSKKLNSWVTALKDTHLSSAYVITSEVCIECEVPDRSISTCGNSQAFTVLKTQLATAGLTAAGKVEYLLKPSGERFRQQNCGDSDACLLIPSSRTFPMRSFHTKSYECSELLNCSTPDNSSTTAYLRASTWSHRGRYEVQESLRAKLLSGWRTKKSIPVVDRGDNTAKADKCKGKQIEVDHDEDQHADVQSPPQLSPCLTGDLGTKDTNTLSALSLTYESAPWDTHPGKELGLNEDPMRSQASDISGPSPRPTGSRTEGVEESEDDIHAQLHHSRSLRSRHNQTIARLAQAQAKANKYNVAILDSTPFVPEASRSNSQGGSNILANYAFNDYGDSDDDFMGTRQPQRVPVGDSPGGWI